MDELLEDIWSWGELFSYTRAACEVSSISQQKKDSSEGKSMKKEMCLGFVKTISQARTAGGTLRGSLEDKQTI